MPSIKPDATNHYWTATWETPPTGAAAIYIQFRIWTTGNAEPTTWTPSSLAYPTTLPATSQKVVTAALGTTIRIQAQYTGPGYAPSPWTQSNAVTY